MHRIGLVLFPGVQVLSLAPLAVFEMANFETGTPFYDVRVLSEAGGPIQTSFGVTVETQRFSRATFDTLIFGGGPVIQPVEDRVPGRGVRVVSFDCLDSCSADDGRQSGGLILTQALQAFKLHVSSLQ